MLYRLDLATSYPSIPALIQHFMDETTLDGVVEVKMVASPPLSTPPTTKGKRSNKSQPLPSAPLQPTTSVISFRREGRDVNAIALLGPASAPSSILTTEGGIDPHRGAEIAPTIYDIPRMVVKKRYPPRTTLVWVFAPLVQKLLDEGADTVVFEVRSYVAGAESAQESQSTLSPVSPYGASHSTTEASPSVLASGSTPSSGGQGPGLDDPPTIQYSQSPVAYPHGDNKAILTELHRRPQELRTGATSFESPHSCNYSPIQHHASIPVQPTEQVAPHWSYPQPSAWSTASGYSDLQPLPPAPAWGSSFNAEGWDRSDPTWQPGSGSGSYGYQAIPPLPWQALQDPPYTPGALDPATGRAYFDPATSPHFPEGFYVSNTGLGDQPSFSSGVPAAMMTQGGGDPMTAYGPSSTSFQGNNRTANWQTQYPYLGALDVPPSEAFPYSPTPRDQSRGGAASPKHGQRPSIGSPISPPDSSERDSLTPTLTNPGYDRAAASTPRKRWPFVRGSANQPAHRATSAYIPASSSLGAPGSSPFRSFSAMLPRARVRLRSGSPEPATDVSIHGVKRLRVNPSLPSGSHLQPPDIASPPPLSAGSSSSAPRSTKSRVPSTIRSGSAAHRSHRTTSPAEQATQDPHESDNALLEILSRPASYKRMLGYAARQHDGGIVAYELSDSVAATTGSDTLLGLGLSSVTNVAALGMELGRRAARRQQESGSRGVVEQFPATTNMHGEHGIPQQPRGGDGPPGHIRGASSKPGWHGCVIA